MKLRKKPRVHRDAAQSVPHSSVPRLPRPRWCKFEVVNVNSCTNYIGCPVLAAGEIDANISTSANVCEWPHTRPRTGARDPRTASHAGAVFTQPFSFTSTSETVRVLPFYRVCVAHEQVGAKPCIGEVDYDPVKLSGISHCDSSRREITLLRD